MSTIRNPVGPQPPSVYWRRRLVALIALVAVIVVIVLIVSAIANSNNKPASTPTNSAKPSNSADPDPSGTPTFSSAPGGAACNPAQVAVTAVTDATSYDSGVNPLISMTITNAGSAPCTFDVGTAAQEYIITSGTDRIWSSKDCQTDPTSTPQVLQPGVPLSTTPFAWDRTRSSTDTCGGSRPAAVAGPDGPTYRLQVKLGTIESETAAFRLF